MSKRLLAASAAFLLAATTNARVTGFYVGVQGGVDLKQLKIFDGSSHITGKTTHKLPKGKSYTYDAASGAQLFMTEEHTETLTGTSSALSGSEDFEATPYAYLVRPSASLFIGYNYQIGPSFVVGLEMKAGLTFGAHKFDGYAKCGAVTQYGTEGSIADGAYKADETGTSKYRIKTESSSEDSYYADMNKFATQAEVKNIFVGDLSLRLGYVVPGTRFTVFARGGIGFARQEFTFKQTGAGAYYYEAAFQAIQADAKVAQKNALIAARQAAGDKWDGKAAIKDVAEANKFVVLSNIRDGAYFVWALEKCLDPSSGFVWDREKNADQAGLPEEIAYFFLDTLATVSHGLNDVCKAEAKKIDPSLSEKKTVFTWHAGFDLEAGVTENLFVRASYTFRHYKKTSIEAQSSEMLGMTSNEMNKLMASDAAKSVVHQLVTGAKDSAGDLLFGSKKDIDTKTNEVFAKLQDTFGSVPEKGTSAGHINHKIGYKNYGHEFSLGLGYRFNF